MIQRLLLITATAAFATEPPVAFPDLQHFAPLWERSIFTTRDLPSPDAPIGPVFTDSLSLAGIYEVDGQVVAVIVVVVTAVLLIRDEANSFISRRRNGPTSSSIL